MILNLNGFSAFPAHSVDQAVRIASEKAIDVAFIELLIGETDAIDAAVRILEVRPYCRIIIWTGRSEPVLSWVRREADGQFGGCELVCKPIDPPQVIRTARGEPVPYEPWTWLVDEDFLSGSEAATVDILERRLAEGHSFLTSVPLLAKPVEAKVLLRWCESGGNPDALSE
jgi:hypothetical protein